MKDKLDKFNKIKLDKKNHISSIFEPEQARPRFD